MSLVPGNSYSLNYILNSYDNLIRRKDDELLKKIGDEVITHLLESSDDENFDKYLDKKPSGDNDTLMKLLWANNNIGKDYIMKMPVNSKIDE